MSRDFCGCQPACHETIYDTFISLSAWPARAYGNSLAIHPLGSTSEYDYSRVAEQYIDHELLARDDYEKKSLVGD